MLPLFTLTIFLGAALLFVVQPMVAKMVLPLLGGSPAVWNTCMVFFQAALLCGYAYAHWSTRALGIRRQAIVHCVVVLLPLAFLPIAIGSGEPPARGSPVAWVLLTLTMAVGLPFFVASTTGPLMQRWFSAARHRSSADPYFLYAASNAGSLIALLSYPLLLEPLTTLRNQSLLWTGGYVLLAAFTIGCAVTVVRRAPKESPAGPPVPAAERETTSRRGLWLQRARWVFLAFLPSSLMLGATQFISTDVAAVPLLWVIPLAIYLLTFILAFSGRRAFKTRNLSDILAIVLAALAIIFLVRGEYHLPVWALFLLHLAALFVAAMFCHSRLADLRPGVDRLTEFYLLLALGGVLGGAFNALLAPTIFSGVLEYPIALVAVAFMRLPSRRDWFRNRPPWFGIAVDIAAAVLIAGTAFALDELAYDYGITNIGVRLGLTVGIPAVCVYLLAPRPRGFALGLAALFAVSIALPESDGRLIHQERTFFGVYRIYRAEQTDETPPHTSLVHGTTVHGAQFLDPSKSSTPLTYYHPSGPIGEVFQLLGDTPVLDHIGLVGLGSGALCAYGRPGQIMTYHEIDPAVIRIASNPDYFTYIRNCRASVEFVVGDGRLTLARTPDRQYGLLVLDAFSSDAIPIHLITKEAVELYLRKIRTDGIIAFHISNQYLSLAPIVARIAQELGLYAYICSDQPSAKKATEQLYYSSDWVILTTTPANLGPIAGKGRWLPLKAKPTDPLWTDSYSDLISVFDFN